MKGKRRSVSKKIRFEVFKRDGFRCAYCGKMPPEVILEIDHIIPVSKKGTNDINNLIASCFDCNRGKRNIELDRVPSKITENIEVLKEKEDQVMELRRFIKKINARIKRDIDKIDKIYSLYFEGWSMTERFKRGTLTYFLKNLPYHEVEDACDIAFNRIAGEESSIKYFCGICHNKIRER